uniref:Uncharacterized protein n=1 Tax=Cannabis sativa TaxID=3483 RepID=A0A803PCP5_CANSA
MSRFLCQYFRAFIGSHNSRNHLQDGCNMVLDVERRTTITGKQIRGMPVTRVGDGTALASQMPSRCLKTNFRTHLVRPPIATEAYCSSCKTTPHRGISELVRENPHRPIGHVGTSTQGETLNARNTTTMPSNRASTKQTTGLETLQRERDLLLTLKGEVKDSTSKLEVMRSDE